MSGAAAAVAATAVAATAAQVDAAAAAAAVDQDFMAHADSPAPTGAQALAWLVCEQLNLDLTTYTMWARYHTHLHKVILHSSMENRTPVGNGGGEGEEEGGSTGLSCRVDQWRRPPPPACVCVCR
jgi:hypothetical protein